MNILLARTKLVIMFTIFALTLSWADLGGTPSVYAQGSVTQSSPDQLAAAIGIDASVLTSTSGNGTDSAAFGVGSGALGRFFPTTGSNFAILATGKAVDASAPNDSESRSTILNGASSSEGEDIAQLSITLKVPANATCLSFDYAFYSEEFPEFVGSAFNDAFVAQLGPGNVTVNQNETITAPGNFALDANKAPISINTSFGIVAGDTQSTYDGGTPLLIARTPVTSGSQVTLTLSILDIGDSIYDSAVLIDNLILSSEANCTAGSQIGTPPPSTPTGEPPRSSNPAQVYIVQAPTPNHAAAPSTIVSYNVELVNIGKGQAKSATVTLPINSAAADVVDVTFSSPDAWVTSVTSSTLVFKTGQIGGKGGKVDATIRLKVKATASAGATLTERAYLQWSDGVKGGEVWSNLPILIVGSADDNRSTYSLTGDPASGSVGSHFSFASSVYAPKEPVGIWWNFPDGKVEAGPTFFAEDDGSLSVDFDSGDLPAGAYSMVFYGHWTKFTATGPFTIK